MLKILSITIPIYLIMAAGFASVGRGLFDKADMRVMGRFVLNFCLPALLFRALSQRNLGEVLNGSFLVAYAAGSLALLCGGHLLSRHVFHKPASLAALKGLGMSASNSGFIGYPILLQVLGPPAGVALALAMLVENLLIIPVALALADRGDGAPQSGLKAVAGSLRTLARNPLILAIVAGFAFALFGWKLPEAVDRTVQIVATGASPVALFVIGGTLVGLKLRGLGASVATVAIGKLLIHPLAVLVVAMLLPPLEPPLRAAVVLLACMPMMSIYPVLAQKYGHDGFCAAALLATTVASFFTISTALAALHAAGWLP